MGFASDFGRTRRRLSLGWELDFFQLPSCADREFKEGRHGGRMLIPIRVQAETQARRSLRLNANRKRAGCGQRVLVDLRL